MLAARMRIVSTLDILSFGRDTPAIRTALENLRRFHDAGGTVTYGTDLGNGAIPAGIHTRELLLLREAGLSNEDVLAALVRAPLEIDAPADVIAREDPCGTCARSTTSGSCPRRQGRPRLTSPVRPAAPRTARRTRAASRSYSARRRRAVEKFHLRCTSVTVVPASAASNVISTSVYGRSSSFGLQSSTRRSPAPTRSRCPSRPPSRRTGSRRRVRRPAPARRPARLDSSSPRVRVRSAPGGHLGREDPEGLLR